MTEQGGEVIVCDECGNVWTLEHCEGKKHANMI
jgi:hypothetical protein